MKIRPVETELFYADRRTDMTKAIVSFRSFVPKNETLIYVQILICVSCWSCHTSRGTGSYAGVVISRNLKFYLNSGASGSAGKIWD